MKNTRLKISGLIASSFLSMAVSSVFAASPVGYWQTIDDVTSKPKSIVEIKELPNHTLQGRVVKLYTDPAKVCTACSGDKKDQPILGMTVMHSLRLTQAEEQLWSNGEILDPKNGKTYHCNLRVSNNDTDLQVRGYLGVPLFGRTQTWHRVTDIKAALS